MSLTSAQQATLKTSINGTSALTAAVTAHDAVTVANFYNVVSATAVWIPDVPNATILSALVAADVAAKITTIAEQALLAALMTPLALDATQPNVRGDFATLFSGTTTLTNLTAAAQRLATALEVLFGSGGPPIVSTLFGYVLQPSDVSQAMGW